MLFSTSFRWFVPVDARALVGGKPTAGSKVELEALYTLGMDFLAGRFLETAVLREDYV